MTILALDVGTKRIGVAVSDPSGTFALPLSVITRTNLRDDCDRILNLAEEYSAQQIVVGDPITLAGTRGQAAESVDAFVNQLARRFGGAIHRIDERMTTAQATKSLIAADVSRSKRKATIDKMAAALILESFLAQRGRQGAS